MGLRWLSEIRLLVDAKPINLFLSRSLFASLGRRYRVTDSGLEELKLCLELLNTAVYNLSIA